MDTCIGRNPKSARRNYAATGESSPAYYIFMPQGRQRESRLMVRQWRIVGLGLALFVLASAMASAQGGRRGGFLGRMGGLQMLRIPEVQKELKMTPEQTGKLDAKQQEVRDAMQGQGGGNFAQMTPEERQARTEKTQDLNDKAVGEILDATQVKRYQELQLQQQGPVAITRKSVATDLKLTDDQKTKLAAIQKQADADRLAAMQGLDFRNMSDTDRQKFMTKLQQMQKDEGDKIVALLTDDQKAQWKTMQGTLFTFPAPPGAPAPAAAPPAVATPAPATPAPAQ